MRDIKFKAKDKNGDWVYGIPLRVYGTGYWYMAKSNKWEPTFDNPDEGEDTVFVQIDISTLCQFTGVISKNGSEIYEGDILYELGRWSLFVEFSDGCFKCRDLDRVRYNNLCTNSGVENFKHFDVIGNIND